MKARHRIFLLLIAISVPLAAALALGAEYLLLRGVESHLREQLRSELRLVVSLLRNPALWSGNLDSLADSYGRALGLRVTIVGTEGRVLGDSALDQAGLAALDNHRNRPELLEAARGGVGESLRYSTTRSMRMVYVASAVEAGSRRLGFARLAVPEEMVNARSWRRRSKLASLFGGALALFLALGYLASRRLARPFEQAAALAEQATVPLGYPALEIRRTEEAQRLATAIRQMRDSLMKSLEEVERERSQLRSTLAGMREGIVVVSPDRHILLTNQTVQDILQVSSPDLTGQPLASAIRNPALLQAFEACCATGKASSETLTLGGISGGTYEIRLQPYAPSGTEGWGAIGVFLDVTQLNALERTRREFILNVSHELRTPLTAVRAAAETLAEGALEDPEHNREFLSIIRRHCERMQALINDLTDLSQIETGAIRLGLVSVDLAGAVHEVLASLKPKAESLKVSVSAAVPDTVKIHADPRRFEQILVNLVDNAIKFNRPGGRVSVSASQDEWKVRIVVADTGTGIPSAHLDKIFHRFHRVDTARSREKGGTGLGLAIVKHLVRLHAGSISVESELGVGSRFTLELPPAV